MNNSTIRLSADTSSLTDTPCKTAEERKRGRHEVPLQPLPKISQTPADGCRDWPFILWKMSMPGTKKSLRSVWSGEIHCLMVVRDIS
ncbi:hypothetical protein [uncultured Ruminobacter sp.]|uniref:hypothetical protein n=1 Tax=uncultured Ruminobacter sp. TaxID=538947 RepID=UPI002628EE3A|nr:hypothetical protein [uncultured Ruminobacter sp.]